MKKRLLAILICVFMVTGLLPGTALAADSTSVTVGGVELDGTAGKTYWKNGDTTSATGTGTDYNAYFNSSTATLTLKNAAISGAASDASNMNSNYGIYADGDLVITLEGTNTVTADAATDFGVSSAIYISGNLTINGSGSLDAIGGMAPGYGSYGVYGDTVTIQDTATVTATGGSGAQLSEGMNGTMDITISGSAIVTATGGKSSGGGSYGVHSNYGDITVSGSANVTATGGYGYVSFGIRTDFAGISIEGGTIIATSGKVKGAYESGYGIHSNGDITYTGGLLAAKGDTYAMNKTVMNDGEPPAIVDPLTGAYDSSFVVYGAADTYHVIQGENYLDYTGAIKPTNVETHITWTEAQDVEPATLTLNNVIVNTGTLEAIKLPSGAKLMVEGVSIVHKSDVEDNSKCISGAGDLEISGTGTLVAIDGAALGGGTCSHGVAAVNDLIVSGSVNLTAIGNTAPYNDSYGVYSGGTATFSGGTINAIGGMAANYSSGVYAYTGTQISDSVKLTAIGGAAGYGSAGIYSSGATTITDGFITAIGGAADGGSSGISSGDTTTISGGRIIAVGGAASSSYSILADGGGIALTGVSIIAPDGAGISDTSYFIATTTGGNIPAFFACIAAVSTPTQPVCVVDGCETTLEDGGFSDYTEIGDETYYHISTAEQLAHINEHLELSYIQTADIDLSEYNGGLWIPIGTEAAPFSGSFDGDGHVIEGLSINGEDYQYAGLFGYADGATFKNLTVGGTIANTYSDAYCYAGGVVAYAKNTQFENCNNEADVSVTSSSTENIKGYAGGIVGYLNADSETDDVALVITSCNNEGTVMASTTQTSSLAYSYNYAGGIVGCFNSYFDAGAISFYITQCTNSGPIEATAAAAVETSASGRTYAGGIIAAANLGGDLDGTLTISECVNVGAISTDTNAYYASTAAGGIAAELIVNKGYGNAIMTIESCKNSAALSAEINSSLIDSDFAYAYIGGIAGYAYTSADYDSTLIFTDCVNDSPSLLCDSIGYSRAVSRIGGIVGHANAYTYESSESAEGLLIIKGSVNMAQITATAEQGNTGTYMHNTHCYAGGVVGYISDIATIMSCYNRGGVAALGNSNYYAGGIAGYASEVGNISSCYSTGSITSSGNSSTNTGGVAGYLYDGAVSDCYWLTGTAGAAVGTNSVTAADASCTEKTVAELQSTVLVTALNAAADAGATLYGLSDMPTWEKAPNLATNNGYPILSWIETPEESSNHGGSSIPTGQQVTVSTPDGGTIVTGTLIEFGNTEEITIGETQFDKLANVNQGAMIPAPSATVTFDPKAVNAINGTTSTGDVVLTIEKLDPANLTSEQQKRVGNRPVYDFTLTKGSQQIFSFDGGHAKISIPYTLQTGENPHQVVIYYLTSAGTLKPVRGHYEAESECVVFETTHFSTYAVGYNPVSFNDVTTGAWYKDAIDFIAAREITSGTGDGVFSPETKLTRGQFIVLLMNAYGISPDAADEGTINFGDAGNTYYTGYLLNAKSLGIVNGIGNNMYAPEQTITRQEMFVMLYNALEVIEELPQTYGDKQLSDFGDVNQVASWAQEAMSALIEGGVISGSNGMLNPTASTSRAEMAQMLYNLLSK